MEEYDIMNNSILKNIQELTEFCVDNIKVNNYYDLVELITDLWNIRSKLIKKDRKLYEEIMKEIEV